ncbi:hypothetical protein D3C76_1559420 [compost metagenome]
MHAQLAGAEGGIDGRVQATHCLAFFQQGDIPPRLPELGSGHQAAYGGSDDDGTGHG